MNPEDAVVGLSKSTSFPVIEVTDKVLAGSINCAVTFMIVIYARSIRFDAVLHDFSAVLVEGLVIAEISLIPQRCFLEKSDNSDLVSAFVLSNKGLTSRI